MPDREPWPEQPAEMDAGGFQDLLNAPRQVHHAVKQEEIDGWIDVLVSLALSHTELVAPEVADTLDAMIADLDLRLSAQMNEIMHDPAFQALESAWRGLHFLVSRTETADDLKIRVLNIGKAELAQTLATDGADWQETPIFRFLHDGFLNRNAAPIGVLVLDWYFDYQSPDLEVLREMAKIGAVCQTPVLAGVAPSLFGLESFEEADTILDMSRLADGLPANAAWNDLRRHTDSCYVGLCLPRILARLPYGTSTNPVEEFDFREIVSPEGVAGFAWMNAAYALAANITRSVSRSGWAVDIRGVTGGGAVQGLPHHVIDRGGDDQEVMCPSEIAVGERTEAALAKAGLISLLHRKGTADMFFAAAPSLNLPEVVEGQHGEQRTVLNHVMARLPYLLVACRYAHYVMRMAAEWRGPLTGTGVESFEAHVLDWFAQYVDPTPLTSSQRQMALRPLEAVAFQIAGDGESRSAMLEIVPSFRLEGVGQPIRLTLTLPRRPGGTPAPR